MPTQKNQKKMSKFSTHTCDVRTIEDYAPLIGDEVVDRILKKAKKLKSHHVTNVNSTYYGGGVAEILSSLTLLMNKAGVETGWRNITGRPDFFSVTKKFHNALQGGPIHLSQRKKKIYEQVVYENSIRTHLNHDLVVIHDPQPLPLIQHYKKKGKWIWRCHIDLSKPNPALWRYLSNFANEYDAVIVSIKEYLHKMKVPQYLFMPAIDPFIVKNERMSKANMQERLDHYKIPTDKPIIVQVSRFDKWKDPEGVIKAFKIARKKIDATLVLLGNAATDDPEGKEVYESLLNSQEERILILAHGDDTALVNALQTSAAVVLQKSTREGFGLTVTEAMWKGNPVIGGNVGGIRYQIEDGVNGFLINSIQEAADRMVTLIKNPKKREQMGKAARESVRKRFLMTRLCEQYFDLFLELVGKK